MADTRRLLRDVLRSLRVSCVEQQSTNRVSRCRFSDKRISRREKGDARTNTIFYTSDYVGNIGHSPSVKKRTRVPTHYIRRKSQTQIDAFNRRFLFEFLTEEKKNNSQYPSSAACADYI